MASPQEVLLKTRRFEVVRRVVTLPSGKEHIHDSIQHPGAVTILPLLEGDKVCLIRNRRAAVDRTLLELPAGTLEPGEDPARTAERELIEETGYRAGSIELLSEFFMSPGIMNERMRVYVARNLTLGDPAREEGEQIENLVVSWDEAMRMIASGEIEDAKTLIGLLYYDRLR